jgi:hypothetical protein
VPTVESRHERIVATIAAKLAAIVAGQSATPTADAYWYTPTVVVRVEDLDVDNLRSQDDVVYQVLEGDEFPKERENLRFLCELEVFILAAKRWQPNTTQPYGMWTPYGATLRNRLTQDIGNCLESDVQLGGLCDNLEIRGEDRGIRIESSVRWASIELRIVVTYDHLVGAR